MLEPLEPRTEPAHKRVNQNLNLRFSSGVQGSNQGSGLNFGIPTPACVQGGGCASRVAHNPGGVAGKWKGRCTWVGTPKWGCKKEPATNDSAPLHVCKGRGCVSGAAHKQKGACTLSAPLHPVDRLRKIPCSSVLSNKLLFLKF